MRLDRATALDSRGETLGDGGRISKHRNRCSRRDGRLGEIKAREDVRQRLFTRSDDSLRRERLSTDSARFGKCARSRRSDIEAVLSRCSSDRNLSEGRSLTTIDQPEYFARLAEVEAKHWWSRGLDARDLLA